MEIISSFDLHARLIENSALGKKNIAYLPVGCTEQHGPFLPLETDSIAAKAITNALCRNLADRYWGYVFPCIQYSPTKSNQSFCGTVSVNNEVFTAHTGQVIESILHSPFDALVVICGHGSADPFLRQTAFVHMDRQFRDKKGPIVPILVLSAFDSMILKDAVFKQKPGKHADWREFLLLHKVLGEEYFTHQLLEKIGEFSKENEFTPDDSHIYGVPVEYRSVRGVIGEPLPEVSTDYAAQAEVFFDMVVDALAGLQVKELEKFWKRTW